MHTHTIILKKDYKGTTLKCLVKLFSSKGYCATVLYKMAHSINFKSKILAHRIHNYNLRIISCDIHKAARIGDNLYMLHSVEAVIGAAATIGSNCSIMSNVTIGAIDNPRVCNCNRRKCIYRFWS